MTHVKSFEDACSVIFGEHHTTVALSAFPRNADTPEYQSLNISRDVAERFRATCRAAIEPYWTRHQSPDMVLNFQLLDHGYTPDATELEWLEFSTNNHLSAHMSALPGPANIQLFQGDKTFLKSLHNYAVILEDNSGRVAILFRRFGPTKCLDRSRRMTLLWNGQQYDLIREMAFSFDESMDCLCYGPHIFILNRSNFLSIFRFLDSLQKSAEKCFETIGGLLPLTNFDDFAECCMSDSRKLAKLHSIAQRPYLSEMSIDRARRTIEQYSLKGVKIVEVDGKEQIAFDKSDKWGLLRLLDDDYLRSELTDASYEVNSKRAVRRAK